MRCERHGLMTAPDGTCVLCRREAQPAPPTEGPSRVLALLVVFVIALAGALVLWLSPRMTTVPPAGGPPSRSAQPLGHGTTGTLATKNSAGRTGSYFLPAGYENVPLPLLVGIHGTGGSGAGMVALFRDAAERERFTIVAPDSRIAPNGQLSWQVPDQAGDTTEDLGHIQRCVAEVRAMPGVVVDGTHTIIVGHSGGASTAPYVASVDDLYGAFAVLHGGVFVGGLGPRRPRGWFSTGDQDPIRPPAGVQSAADSARGIGLGVELHVFHEGHDVGAEERRAVIAWWLRR